jgi:hypothetical protein
MEFSSFVCRVPPGCGRAILRQRVRKLNLRSPSKRPDVDPNNAELFAYFLLRVSPEAHVHAQKASWQI